MVTDGGFAQCPLRRGGSKYHLLVPEEIPANMTHGVFMSGEILGT